MLLLAFNFRQIPSTVGCDGFSAYIPQKQKVSFDAIISLSPQDATAHSDVDSVSMVKDQPWKKTLPTTTTTTTAAAAAAIGNKLVGQTRY